VRSDAQHDTRARLEAQRRALAAACTGRGWHLLEVLEEAGLAAKDRKRPGIQEARRVRERADAQAFVAGKRERLSQALLDLVALLASAQKQGWALVALDCALETTPPAGEAVVNVRASFAPCERRLISQRIRRALARKRAQGVRLGRPPTMAHSGRNGPGEWATRRSAQTGTGTGFEQLRARPTAILTTTPAGPSLRDPAALRIAPGVCAAAVRLDPASEQGGRASECAATPYVPGAETWART